VNDLLKKARRGTVILESSDGQRFALTAISGWVGFDVGTSRNFAEEVERTVQNKKLMKFLAARHKHGKAPGIPLAEVKKQLGIE
jgi:hypothetical protein